MDVRNESRREVRVLSTFLQHHRFPLSKTPRILLQNPTRRTRSRLPSNKGQQGAPSLYKFWFFLLVAVFQRTVS